MSILGQYTNGVKRVGVRYEPPSRNTAVGGFEPYDPTV